MRHHLYLVPIVVQVCASRSSSSLLEGSGGGCSRFHPRKPERAAGDEEANFYKNGMEIKTSEGIMD